MKDAMSIEQFKQIVRSSLNVDVKFGYLSDFIIEKVIEHITQHQQFPELLRCFSPEGLDKMNHFAGIHLLQSFYSKSLFEPADTANQNSFFSEPIIENWGLADCNFPLIRIYFVQQEILPGYVGKKDRVGTINGWFVLKAIVCD